MGGPYEPFGDFWAAFIFVVAVAFPVLARWLPRSATAISVLRVRYPDGRGLLRELLQLATERGFAIDSVSTETVSGGGGRTVEVTLHVHGRGQVNELAAALSEVEEVEAVLADDANSAEE